MHLNSHRVAQIKKYKATAVPISSYRFDCPLMRKFWLVSLLLLSSYAHATDGSGPWTYGNNFPPLFLTPDEACQSRQVQMGFSSSVARLSTYNDPNVYQCWGYPSSSANGSYYANSNSVPCVGNTVFDPSQSKCVPGSALPPAVAPPASSTNVGQPTTTSTPPGTCTPQQPCIGDPINPATGNMWNRETDYASSGAPGGLILTRTYNSTPYNWDAYIVRRFGARWITGFDASLQAEPTGGASASSACVRRDDTGYVWCVVPLILPNGSIPAAVSIVRGDGKKALFQRSGMAWTGNADSADQLTATYSADNSTVLGWTFIAAPGDVTQQFDANGILISQANRSGTVQRFTYSNGGTNDTSIGRIPADAPVCSHVQAGDVMAPQRLLCATDNWGHQLQFEYDGMARITKVIDPNNGQTSYAYDGASGGCSVFDANNPACTANNLTQVTFPDGTSKIYHYNEAAQINNGTACPIVSVIGNGFGSLLNSMTGIDDENGARHVTWTYDCYGRATSSQLAGGAEKVVIAYGAWDSNASTSVVTHSLGDPANPQTTVSNYSYGKVLDAAKNGSIDQPCAECGPAASRTYDSAGNLASQTDWKGNVTTYTYDLQRNLQTSRTEAAGTPQARTTSTQWHATYRLPITIAEPKRMTTFVYDTSGNLLSKTVRATTDANGSQAFSATQVGTARTWQYTYNAAGQVLTATGPRTDVADVTASTYDSQGNLASITNAAGQITTYSNYDANGHVGTITAPNGMVTTMTYSPRGWVLSRSVTAGGVTENTTYTYDGIGQMKLVTMPDNSTISYTYDDAHRLTQMADSIGNTITYALDIRGNRIAEQAKDPNGVLTRQSSRVYDALNRLQQVTGSAQ